LEAGADLLDAIFVMGAITSRAPLESSNILLGKTVVHDRADRLAEAVGRLGRYDLTNPNVPVLVSITLDRLFPRVSFEQSPHGEWLELSVRDDLSSATSVAEYESAVRHFLTRALHAAAESGAHQSHLIEFLLHHGAEPWTKIMLLPDTIDIYENYVYDELYVFAKIITSHLEYSPDRRSEYWHEARGIPISDKSEVDRDNLKSLQLGYERSNDAIQISLKQGDIRKRLQRLIKAVSKQKQAALAQDDIQEQLPTYDEANDFASSSGLGKQEHDTSKGA